jgi:hypothetical protein
MNVTFAILFGCGGLALAVLLGMVLYKDNKQTAPAGDGARRLEENTEAA